ncbi:hypothetical protein ABZP36_017106 [Zizania latifolia]
MRGPILAMSSLLFLVALSSFSITSALTKARQVYIVYLGEHAGEKAEEEILERHHGLLLSVKDSEEEARASLLYSYKHSLNGFAALLSEEEATELSERTEVVATFSSEGRWSPHTTRSWEFLGVEEGVKGPDSSGRRLPPGAEAGGEDVIVGVLDSGSNRDAIPVTRQQSVSLGLCSRCRCPWHSPKRFQVRQCLPNSLAPEHVRGKIVVCLRGTGLRVEKGLEVKRAGGAAIVVGNPPAYGSEVPVDAHVLPGTAVSTADVNAILRYVNSSSNPTAVLDRSRTVVDVKPSPVMAQFSSRGPNAVEPNILKPDVTAPGLNILAAWSEASSPTKLDGDNRVVKYNIVSGTSMSCPHVSATAVLLKSAHPDWSSAAIRSAIMTTATTSNAEGGPIMDADGTVAGPMDYGSGHIRPNHAMDPGLVYDASYQDYLLFACASGGAQLDHSLPCPASPPPPYGLNHPSLSIRGLNGTITVQRTVTNVGQGNSLYSVAVVEPMGVSVKVWPSSLRFSRAGEKKSFTIKIEAAKGRPGWRANGQFVAGSYTWSDGVHVVRSPIVVLAA